MTGTGPVLAEPDRAMRLLTWLLNHSVLLQLVVAIDAWVQRAVDESSFLLHRAGVLKSSQLAGGHVAMALFAAAEASDSFRSSDTTTAVVCTVLAVLWILMALAAYVRERYREQLTGPALPTGRFVAARALAFGLVAAAASRGIAGDIDWGRLASGVVLIWLVYLQSTPRKPPPRRPRRVCLPMPVHA